MKTIRFKLLMTAILLLTVNQFSFASDHIDGPATMSHGVADISDLYAFPTPNRRGNLSLVLNVYPMVPANGHFSEKVNYIFLLRTVDISGSFKQAVTYVESKIICSFKTPHHKSYSVTCRTDKGLSAKAKIGKKQHKGDFRLFAGMVSDPFYLNVDWVKNSMVKGKLTTPSPKNIMDKLNVLSIVIDIEIDKVFEDYRDELLAVAAKSVTRDGPNSNWRQLDWVGRPEITNFSLSPNGKNELRDKYNSETPFTRPFKYENLYFKRLYKNITLHYDRQDNRVDWDEDTAKQLVSILMDDYLLLAPNLACNDDSYFDIEMSILKNSNYTTCGGRKLTDDIVDKVLSLYITSNTNDLVDGVDYPYREISGTFPYLSTPDTSLSARIKAWFARKFK